VIIRILSLLIIALPSLGQGDSLLLQQATSASVVLYTQTIKGQTLLYSGPQYRSGPILDGQHPFFGADDWTFGSVTYNGYRFDNVPLLYDIAFDVLVTENYYTAHETALVKEKVEAFEINGRQFIRIDRHQYEGSLPTPGFYEMVYDGTTTVLARHTKFENSRIESKAIVIDYKEKVKYFILRGTRFFPVKTKRSILNVLADEKQALRQYIRQHNLFPRVDRRGFLLQVAAHYDTLTATNE